VIRFKQNWAVMLIWTSPIAFLAICAFLFGEIFWAKVAIVMVYVLVLCLASLEVVVKTKTDSQQDKLPQPESDIISQHYVIGDSELITIPIKICQAKDSFDLDVPRLKNYFQDENSRVLFVKGVMGRRKSRTARTVFVVLFFIFFTSPIIPGLLIDPRWFFYLTVSWIIAVIFGVVTGYFVDTIPNKKLSKEIENYKCDRRYVFSRIERE
jgi:hypothetical protein